MGEPTGSAIRIDMNMLKAILACLVFVGGVASGIMSAATWKANIENHLQQMDNHLQDEDKHLVEQKKQLQWLIRHTKTKDPDDTPPSGDPSESEAR